MTCRVVIHACVLLVALSAGKTARAAASRFQLTWTAPSVERPCVSEEELKHAVSARLGRDPFVPEGQGEIAVDGRELPAPAGRWRARIVQRERDGRVLGTRDLEATSCEELRRSATFVVFLIVDPDAALGGPPSEPVPADAKHDDARSTEPPHPHGEGEAPSGRPEERRSTSRGRSTEGAVSSVPPSRAPGVRVDLGLALIVSNGLLPKPDVGPAFALGFAPPSLPIRFEWRATYRIAVQRAQGYDFRAVAQEVRACYSRRVLGPAFGTACGGVAWTAILPEAPGLAGGDQAPKNVFSPALAVGPALELDGTRLVVELGLTMPQPRYSFSYRDEGRVTPLHEVSRIAWSFGIGAARAFR